MIKPFSFPLYLHKDDTMLLLHELIQWSHFQVSATIGNIHKHVDHTSKQSQKHLHTSYPVRNTAILQIQPVLITTIVNNQD